MKRTKPLKMPQIMMKSTQTQLGFHLLVKPTGAACNLDCQYCFFLSKEMLYPGSQLPYDR